MEQQEKEKNLFQQYQDMTERLIALVTEEKDIKAINPELIREIRESVKYSIVGY